ncbi:hypothetical protein PHYBOEH_000278 [Phytophthora boehmeriae]|uniref:Uncharacterized protein n=1 Tax=Phytophthora boehmeriae TaxID=109152 RepID=A0A8T1X199_9STRA|nr:hypothetical protein PHYBOEH_000278 [Phytophthora boehmeriae]
MDEAKVLLAELQAAQDEHQRALVATQQARDDLDCARKEYEDAQAAERAGEEELAHAAEVLARGLQSLDVTADSQSAVPLVVDSLVEYHANIGCYQCYLFLDGHKDGNKEEERNSTFDVALLGVRVEFPLVEVVLKRSRSDCKSEKEPEAGEVVWRTEIERNVDVSQSSVENKGDHWYLRLPIRPSDKQPLGGFSSFTQLNPRSQTFFLPEK